MKVLIVRLSAFGDIIHCLPALDDLLHHPEISEVHWLVDQRYRFVCDIFPRHVKIHTVALRGKQPLRSAWQAIRELQESASLAALRSALPQTVWRPHRTS